MRTLQWLPNLEKIIYNNFLNLALCILLISAECCDLSYNLYTLTMSSAKLNLKSTEFEVFGRVQGVFFRKYTQQEANKLGLKGWCMNTSQGTVKGVLEGESSNVDFMKEWLKSTGSPASRIDKTEFIKEKEITKLSYNDFRVKH